MTSTATQAACACTGCAAVLYGNIWMASALTTLLIIAVMLDFYHIWRRCRDRQERMHAILNKKRRSPTKHKEDCTNGGCSCS